MLRRTKALLGVFIGLFAAAGGAAKTEQADPQSFAALAQGDDVILLDVRTPEEIASGKIAGASELDFYSKDFKRKLSYLQDDKTILVYCRSGARSSEAANMLQKMGHEHVVNLFGGIMSWQAQGLPLEVAAGAPKPPATEPIDADALNAQASRGLTLLNFHTQWCAPCKRMAPVIDQLESDNKDRLRVVRIDLDANQSLADRYGIKAVPTFILLKDGEEIWRESGPVGQETIESQL